MKYIDLKLTVPNRFFTIDIETAPLASQTLVEDSPDINLSKVFQIGLTYTNIKSSFSSTRLLNIEWPFPDELDFSWHLQNNRETLINYYDSRKCSLDAAFMNLGLFYAAFADNAEIPIYCRGANFDFPLLKNTFITKNSDRKNLPWGFRSELCSRTLCEMFDTSHIENKNPHNALADANWEAEKLKYIFKAIANFDCSTGLSKYDANVLNML